MDQVNVWVEIPGEEASERGMRRMRRKQGDKEETGSGGQAGDGPGSPRKDSGSD